MCLCYLACVRAAMRDESKAAFQEYRDERSGAPALSSAERQAHSRPLAPPRRAWRRVNTILTSETPAVRLTPDFCNLHSFTAIEATAVIDLLMPPYDDAERDCHYFAPVPPLPSPAAPSKNVEAVDSSRQPAAGGAPVAGGERLTLRMIAQPPRLVIRCAECTPDGQLIEPLWEKPHAAQSRCLLG
jgi:hypothetical protein